VVISFAAISLLVLLIGSINFTILTTAKATQRAREVAMRKVVGAKRKQLIAQFLGESLFIVLLSMILSMGVVEIMLPIFEAIVGKYLFLELYLSFDFSTIYWPCLSLLDQRRSVPGIYPFRISSLERPEGEPVKGNPWIDCL
jgi:putative ABC transport system permease protein